MQGTVLLSLNNVELFYLQRHRYPTSEEGLQVLIERTAQQPAGIISELPHDPWGEDYIYVYPGQHAAFDIISLGRDHAEGGDGEDRDIVSWKMTDME